MTDNHVKLNSLDDMQEILNSNHHKIAFNYDEDTMSLVEELTHTTSEIPLLDNSHLFAGNAPIAIEYYCCDIETNAP